MRVRQPAGGARAEVHGRQKRGHGADGAGRPFPPAHPRAPPTVQLQLNGRHAGHLWRGWIPTVCQGLQGEWTGHRSSMQWSQDKWWPLIGLGQFRCTILTLLLFNSIPQSLKDFIIMWSVILVIVYLNYLLFISICLSSRSHWCCSSSTHSTPFVTSSSLPLTTWSRSAQANSSPTWTETSCTRSSSSGWTTAQPDWAATSANDRVSPSLPSTTPSVLRWDDALWRYHPCFGAGVGVFPAHTLYWDCFSNHRDTGCCYFNKGNSAFYLLFIVHPFISKRFKYLLTSIFFCFYILIHHQSTWLIFGRMEVNVSKWTTWIDEPM